MYKPDLEFQKQHDFSEKINSTFTFWRQNFSKLGYALLMYSAPFFILAFVLLSLLINHVFMNFTQTTGTGTGFMQSSLIFYGVFTILLMLGYTMVICVLYSYIKLYVERGKANFGSQDIWEVARENYFKTLLLQFIYISLVTLGVVLCIIPGIYISVVLFPVFFIAIYEDSDAFTAIKRCFSLHKGYWWQTFAVLLVIYLIIAFVSQIFIIPPYFATIFMTLNDFSPKTIIYIVLVFTFIYIIGLMLVYTIPLIVIALQYFNIVEAKENPTLINRIQKINNTNDDQEFDLHDDI